MLKFAVIGALITGIIAYILWNLWNMVILKHEKFAESKLYFTSVSHIADSESKIKIVRKEAVKNWGIAFAGTFFAVALVLTYFLVARNVFFSNHTHSYKQHVITKVTCTTEGLLEQKCRYCDEKYEEAIPVIEHKYSKSNHIKSTCSKNGLTEYTCKICGDIKTETLPLKEHKYKEKIKKEPTCTKKGILEKSCKNCNYVKKEKIPVNGNHSFKVLSFTHSTFWKNGYNHYSCKACGDETYSLKVEKINWITVLAILILLGSIIIIVAVYIDEGLWRYIVDRPSFWIAVVFAVLSCAVLVFHYGFAVPHQKNHEPFGQKLTNAPIGCELVAKKSDKDGYLEKGSISYKCKKCSKKYTEYLLLDPKCTDHTETTEHYLKKPKCEKPVKVITVCDRCSTVTSVKTIDSFGHNWGKWKTVKSDSSWLLNSKMRTCKLCREKQSVRISTFFLIIPLIICNILWMILCAFVLTERTNKFVLYVLATLALTLTEAFLIIKAPIFGALWDGVALGIILSVNSIMIVQLICYCGFGRTYYAYESTPIVLTIIFALTVALGFTFLADYIITCVIIMVALAINAIVQAVKANSRWRKKWIFANVAVALVNIGSAIFFLLKK